MENSANRKNLRERKTFLMETYYLYDNILTHFNDKFSFVAIEPNVAPYLYVHKQEKNLVILSKYKA